MSLAPRLLFALLLALAGAAGAVLALGARSGAAGEERVAEFYRLVGGPETAISSPWSVANEEADALSIPGLSTVFFLNTD